MLLSTGKLFKKFFSNGFFLRKGFCQGKLNIQGLNLNKQKADLSFQIYQLILNQVDALDLEEKSLHEMIMEKIHQKSEITDMEKSHLPDTSHQPKDMANDYTKQQGFKYHEQARKPFIDLFETGYKIDQQIFDQTRFNEAKIQTNGPNKFIFHPTYLITKQVFKKLHKLQNARKILTGHYGISKSVSVCLFSYLVKFMDEYRFQKGVTVSEQMMLVPKVVYLTLNEKSQDQQDYFKRIILHQCPEIMKEYNLSDWSQYKGKLQNIKYFYRRYFSDLNVILIIDQINRAAQLGKTYEKKQQLFQNVQKRRQEKNYDYQGQLKKIKRQVELFSKFKQNIEHYILRFGGFLGLSQINLQYNFFEQIKFTVASNTKVPQINSVKYPSELYKSQSLAQMADFFIFQMNQRVFKNLKNTKVSEVDRKEMKKICYDEMNKRLLQTKKQNDERGKEVLKKQYFYFTPLDIRQKVRKYTVQKYDKSISQLKEKVRDTFKNFLDDMTEDYKTKLLKNFQKKDEKEKNYERKKLMLSIYQYIASKQNQSLKLQPTQVKQVKQIPIKELKFKKEKILQYLEKRLFQYDQESKAIMLMLPSSFVMQVIKPCIKKHSSIYAQVLKQQVKKFKHSLLGCYLQFKFTQALSIGDIKISFNLNYESKIKQVQKYQFDIKDQIYQFQHLQTSASKKPINLLNRFKKKIKQMRQKELEQAVFFPVIKDYEKKKSSQQFNQGHIVSNSKIIDFVLIKNSRKTRFISIWIVDLTISQIQTIESKIQKFLKQFLEFSDKNVTQLSDIQPGLQVQLNYLVFGTDNDFKHQKIKEALKNQFKSKITFKTYDGSNVFTVDKLGRSKICLLKRVGYIQLKQNFQFEIINQQSKKNEQVLLQLIKKI